MGSTSERPGLGFQTDKHDGFWKQLCSKYDRLDFMLMLSENKSERSTTCKSAIIHISGQLAVTLMIGDHDHVVLPETARATHVCYCNNCFMCAAFSSSDIFCQGTSIKSSPGLLGVLGNGYWCFDECCRRTTRQTTLRRRRSTAASNPIQNLLVCHQILFRCSSS